MSKIKLVEDFNESWGTNHLPRRLKELKESEKIVEADGVKYSAFIAYECPVWKLNEKNLNGRTYPNYLGEKIVVDFKNLATFALADHPEGEGSVRDIVAVAKNPHIRENILYADCYFVDEAFGKKVAKIIEAGKGIGLSSSAYGTLDESGNVEAEDFELERFFDFVLNPSYGVELDSTGIKEKVEPITEAASKEPTTDKDSTNTIVESTKKEKMMDKTKVNLSLEEENFRDHVEQRFEKAQSIASLKEKIEAYETLSVKCSDKAFAIDLKEKADTELASLNEELGILAEKGKGVESLEEANTSLKQKFQALKEDSEHTLNKYSLAAEMIDSLKERQLQLTEMYKVAIAGANGKVKASKYNEAMSYIDGLEEDLNESKRKSHLVLKDLRETVELKENLESELLDLKSHYERRLRVESTKERSISKKLSEGDKEREELEQDIERRREATLTRESAAQERADLYEKELAERDARLAALEEKTAAEEKEFVGDAKLEEDTNSTAFNFSNSGEVEAYYYDLYEQDPSVERIKESILEKKTIYEAQKTYLNLKSLLDDVIVPRIGKGKIEPIEEKVEYRSFSVRKDWD